MHRRIFVQKLLAFLPGLTLFPPTLFGADPYPAGSITLQAGGRQITLPVMKKWGQYYLSLVDFSQNMNLGIFTNQEKRKTVISVGSTKLKFTARNTFVLINDQPWQVFYPPLWQNGELWVNAQDLAELLTNHTNLRLEFNASKGLFKSGRKNINISQIAINEKQNGTLIHIFTEVPFKKEDIALRRVNKWLYVEIYGGRVEAKALNRKQKSGIISEIQAIQFQQSVSLAFKLRGEFVSKELMIGTDDGDIYVTLRSKTKPKQDEETNDSLEKQKKEWLIHTIVIDPGHGGKDPGAIGYGRLKEKNIVLPVGLKLGKALKKRLPDVNIVYTRKTDVFIPLWKRTKIANTHNGKLFISLHCNSNPNHRVRGFETFFLSADKDEKARNVVLKENESVQFESKSDQKRYEGINFVLATLAQNAFIKYSQYLATVVQKSMANKLRSLDMKSRGVKQGPFWVMVGATMPNILVEMGFISNKYEAKQLKRKSTQTRIADAIADGIVKYKKDIESAL